jgi:hypothetical protein
MNVASRIWLAANVPGYSEMRDFHHRMAEKLNWTPGSNMFMAQAEIAQGMAQAQKEIAKLEGVPVFQTLVMGGDGSGQPAPQQQQQQAERPSIGGALGGALGGRFGLGRKKQQDPPPPPPPAEGGQTAAAGSLLEMTTEYSSFSTGPVDEGNLNVPTGFKKVEPDLKVK